MLVPARIQIALVVRNDEREGFVQIRIREEHLSRPVRRHRHARHHEVAVPLRELRREPFTIHGHEGEGDAHLARQAMRELDIEAHQVSAPD